jgi:DNA-binding NarL/FixJ family response regulator
MPARVLIADDHASIRRGVRALLEKGGYQVCCEAADGREAVRLAKQCTHDVVILDLLMPNLNGFHAAAEISRLHPDLPIVLHTLYGGSAVEREAQKFGVAAVASKLGAPALKEVVDKVVSGPGHPANNDDHASSSQEPFSFAA